MNITANWDNEEKTILRYQFAKGWDWLELRDVFNEGYAMLDTVEHTVCVIMDFTNASVFAPSGAINQARHVSDNPRHPNIGLTAVAGSRFISGIFQIIKRLTGNASKWDITFVNTLEEAYDAISDYQKPKSEDAHS